MANVVSNELSFASIPIELVSKRKGAIVHRAIGTGFLWENNGYYYLVTNLHNLSGWDFETEKAMSGPTAALPTDVQYVIAVQVPKPGGYTIQWVQLTSPLTFPKHNQWLIHPTYGTKIDVSATLLGRMDGKRLWPDLHEKGATLATLPLNKKAFVDFAPHAGDDAFVIGFPRGLHGPGKFPIWKRASLASEPDFPINDLPLTLVDTATREGMSGSPVIVVRRGYTMPRGGKLADARLGLSEAFLGVYSGRIGVDELGVQLGRVWKAEVIDEIVRGNVHGKLHWQ